MGAILGLGLLALLAFAGRGRRRRPGALARGAPGDLCAVAPATVAAFRDDARIVAWVDCAGRTGVQVAQLTAALRRAGRGPLAEDVTRRWNARRAIDSAAPDGAVQGPHAAAVETATTAPTPPAGVPDEPRGTVTFPTAADVTREPGDAGTTGPDAEGWYTASDGTRIRRSPALVFPAADDSTVRALATAAAAALRRRTNYRAPLRAFQRAALIAADGVYGGLSQSALAYFGAAPPAAFRRPPASAAPYPPAAGPVVTAGDAPAADAAGVDA